MNNTWRVLILFIGVLWGMVWGISGGSLGALGVQPAQAALVVNEPNPVLMVDGKDNKSTVGLIGLDLTGLPAGYDFGFMEGEVFVPMALRTPSAHRTRRPASFHGFYVFEGGSSINFALRYDPTGAIYTMSDPADYVSQLYSRPVTSFQMSNQAVVSPSYRTLTLDWQINGSGFDALGTQGLIITLHTLRRFDGMAPDAAPVNLPASILLFSSGLVGLAAWRRMVV